MTDTFDFQSLFKGSATKELQRQFVGMEFQLPPQTDDNFDPAFVAKKGILLDRSAHAPLWMRAQVLGWVDSEANWQAAKSLSPTGAVSFYSDGDGLITFRTPTTGVGGFSRAVGEMDEAPIGSIDGGFGSQVEDHKHATPLLIELSPGISVMNSSTNLFGSVGLDAVIGKTGRNAAASDFTPPVARSTLLTSPETYNNSGETSPQGSYCKTFIYTGADTPDKAPTPTLEQMLSAAALRNILYNTDHVNQTVNQRQFHGDWSLINVGVYGWDGWLKYSATHKAQIIEVGDFEDRDYLLSYDGVAVKTIRPPDGTATPWLVAVPQGVNLIDLRPSEVKVPRQSEDQQVKENKCLRYFWDCRYETPGQAWVLMYNIASNDTSRGVSLTLPVPMREVITNSDLVGVSLSNVTGVNVIYSGKSHVTLQGVATNVTAAAYIMFSIDKSLTVADAVTNITVVN